MTTVHYVVHQWIALIMIEVFNEGQETHMSNKYEKKTYTFVRYLSVN